MRMMRSAVLYLPGKGGCAAESAHYRPLFPGCAVMGLDYTDLALQTASRQVADAVQSVRRKYESVTLIANSIGACYAMLAGIDGMICKAYWISPIVDPERLLSDMLQSVQATEAALQEKGMILSASGDPILWEDFCCVKTHPVRWTAPTEILYGSADTLTPYETVAAFAEEHGAGLTVMAGGEHWFHTAEQMDFLDRWILTSEKQEGGLRT